MLNADWMGKRGIRVNGGVELAAHGGLPGVGVGEVYTPILVWSMFGWYLLHFFWRGQERAFAD